jgi:hypothetical protein
MSFAEDDRWTMPVDPLLVLPSELERAFSMQYDHGLLRPRHRSAT